MSESHDPLALFHAERARARAAEDPMANLCTVANVDEHQRAQLRTLVLREVGGELAVFVNATSPKWRALTTGFAMHTFWPSVNVQYRFQVQATDVDADIVAESWQLRPDAPKRMDWFYEQHIPQSQPIASRDELLSRLAQVKLNEPLTAPANARGLIMQPVHIERLDLNQPNGVHDRRAYALTEEGWVLTTLVP